MHYARAGSNPAFRTRLSENPLFQRVFCIIKYLSNQFLYRNINPTAYYVFIPIKNNPAVISKNSDPIPRISVHGKQEKFFGFDFAALVNMVILNYAGYYIIVGMEGF